MKHICKYLLTILPFVFMLIGCDDDNIPTYRQLELDANEVQFNYALNETIAGVKEINILEGNNNYMLSQMSNDLTSIEALDKVKEILALGGNADTIVVAVAKLEGNKLVITPKYTGTIQYKLQDWTKSSQIITIIVDQDKPAEEIVTRLPEFNLRVDDKKSTEIYSGNGGYKVESLDLSIATVSLEGLKITATAIAAGNTKIKITDQKGQEGFVEVNVDDKLIPLVLLGVEEGQQLWLTTGGIDNVVLNYEGGNGSLTSSSLYANIVIDEDAKTITISGKTSRTMTTLKVSDRYGQEIAVNIVVDHPFLDNTSPRMLKDNKFSTISRTKLTAEYITSLNRTIIHSGTTYSGVGITFSGDMSLGVKKDGKVYNVTSTGSESPGTDVFFSECEVVKISNKMYWITFTQKDSGQKGYVVIPTP